MALKVQSCCAQPASTGCLHAEQKHLRSEFCTYGGVGRPCAANAVTEEDHGEGGGALGDWQVLQASITDSRIRRYLACGPRAERGWRQ